MPKLKDHHKTDICAGMVRFDTTGSGKKKSSNYLTFRVMSEKSSGWIIPATQGLLLAKHAQTLLQPILDESIKKVFSE